MPSAVDSAIQDASQAIDTSGIGKDSAEGLQLGMSLAQRQASIEQQRQTLQFQQQQHEMQKHDWLHDQLSSAMSENDPKLRHIMLDNMDDTFPKIFDGKRMNPSIVEAMKKAPNFADKAIALGRVRKAMLQGKPEAVGQFDREVLNDMTSSDISSSFKNLNNIYTNESRITGALIGAGVVNPAAAAAMGQSQGEAQASLDASPKFLNQKARLAVRIDDQAKSAGEAFDHDPKLTQFYKQKAGIERAQHTIASGGVINPQMKREIEAEISTALSGQGVAGEGKLARIEFEPAAVKAADWLQKFENKPVDLQKAAPGVIQYLKQTLDRLNGAYAASLEDVAVGKAQNYAQSSNPKVSAVVKSKLMQYAPNYYGKTYGAQAAAQSGVSQVNNATGGPTQPKMTIDQRMQYRNMALQKLQQIRSSPQGMLSTSEGDVKDKYKLLTGEELAE